MFKDLLLNPQTIEALEMFAKKPSHAVLISGQSGSGKMTAAKRLAAGLLSVDEDKLESYAHFLHVKKAEDKKDIAIEQIRSIVRELGLKIPGRAELRRVILIENAGTMSLPAQNALLKSLEEPSIYSVFILTDEGKSSLLPTISSRTTKIAVRPVGLASAKKYFTASPDEVEIAWNLSRGLPGLMSRLLSTEPSELRAAVASAKGLLAMSVYERTVVLDKTARDKAELDKILDALARIIQALYKSAAAKKESAKLGTLTKAMTLVLSAQNALADNAAPRLVALQIATNLPI